MEKIFKPRLGKIIPIFLIMLTICFFASYIHVKYIKVAAYSLPSKIVLIFGFVASIYWLINQVIAKVKTDKEGLWIYTLRGWQCVKWKQIQYIDYQGGYKKFGFYTNERAIIQNQADIKLYIGVRLVNYGELWKIIYDEVMAYNPTIQIDKHYIDRIMLL